MSRHESPEYGGYYGYQKYHPEDYYHPAPPLQPVGLLTDALKLPNDRSARDRSLQNRSVFEYLSESPTETPFVIATQQARYTTQSVC